MNKIKVLIIPSWYPIEKKSSTRYFFKEQTEALAEYVDIVVLNINLVLNPFKLYKKIENINNVKTYNYNILNLFPKMKTKYMLYKFKTLLTFNEIINDFGKPNIIHAHVSYLAGCQALILKEKYNILIIITEQLLF